MSDETESVEPKDTRGPAVAVTGSLLGGFKFYGPFDTIDSAIEWWMQTLCHSAGVTIALLEPPGSLSKRKEETK